MMKSSLKNHPQAAIILAAFIILAAIYSVATPPLEAGDESRHYAVVKYILETNRLPVQNVPETAELQHHWSHEGNQPPLYYALAALLTVGIETGDWDEVFWYNPHTTIGNPLRLDNKNITIHPPSQAWPWRGSVLAVHLIRFLSIAMATVTILTAYWIALALFKGNRWIAAGAMAITAFNPMFIFISASINNDNAVIMFVTLALGVMVWMVGGMEDWKSETLDRWKYNASLSIPALLGLLIGLGTLSKLYAFGLIPLAGLLFVWIAYTTESTESSFSLSPRFWRKVIVWNVTMLFVIFVVAGWFYIRNAILYEGDILALEVMRHTAGERDEIPSLATIQAEFKGFRIAYWALFGGVNILVDDWIYIILDWVSLVAALGVFIFIVLQLRIKSIIINKSPNFHYPVFIILLGWYLIMIAGFIVWNLTQPAGQGRLLYPAIAAISAMGIWGLTWWLPSNAQRGIVIICGIGLFCFALLSPLLYIAPAYAKSPILSHADLTADIQPVGFIYDDTLRLIGYKLDTSTVRAAEALPITLYWEILKPATVDYSIFVHLLGRGRQKIGQIDSYPGQGSWPTTLLQPGDIIADYYEVMITPEAEFDHAPTQIKIATGIYNIEELGLPSRPVVNAQNQPIEPLIGTTKLIPWNWPDPPTSENPVNFFDKVTLLNHQISEDSSTLTFTWQVQQRFDTDYTLFIQAWQLDTNEYTHGFDGPPVQGNYPTSLWEANEVVIDTHTLDLNHLPSGRYKLLAGLYNPVTGERLPAFGPEG
ncbi:MAG: hypothetical protein AAF485_07510, partial [Chloroflexota bacterium]